MTLQRVRTRQMLEITAEGTLTFEMREPMQAVLQEAWVEDKGVRFVLL